MPGFVRRQLRRIWPANVAQADVVLQHLVEVRRSLAFQALQRILHDPTQLNQLFQSGLKLYSQNEEDGILQAILREVGEGERRFFEIGAGDGTENNTLHLLLLGWRGSWVEADQRKTEAAKERWAGYVKDGTLQVIARFLSVDNLGDLAMEASNAEILSIDIDGNDYHILERLGPLRCRVVVLEYAARLGPWVDWVMPYDAEHRWDYTDRAGASLVALNRLMSDRGYVLVGCNVTGVNAFFVRRELVGKRFKGPFTPDARFVPYRPWLKDGMSSGQATGIRNP